jgi:hypothetical protein
VAYLDAIFFAVYRNLVVCLLPLDWSCDVREGFSVGGKLVTHYTDMIAWSLAGLSLYALALSRWPLDRARRHLVPLQRVSSRAAAVFAGLSFKT